MNSEFDVFIFGLIDSLFEECRSISCFRSFVVSVGCLDKERTASFGSITVYPFLEPQPPIPSIIITCNEQQKWNSYTRFNDVELGTEKIYPLMLGIICSK